MNHVINEEGSRQIKVWTDHVEDTALKQLKNLARLPFIADNGVACMPDVHAGIGSTVGTVIATDKAIIPAAVGVDIGCGMNAVRLSLKASDLPESLLNIRHQIERDVPLGAGGSHKRGTDYVPPGHGTGTGGSGVHPLWSEYHRVKPFGDDDHTRGFERAWFQLGTLGSGNHFIELCLDENDDVWVMLHSGSRGTGNEIGRRHIEKAKKTFTAADLAEQTKGVECAKGKDYVDEIPGAYKDIDVVMSHQTDLVEVVHVLKQVLCVKGK